jgi:diadenylate cyclase
MSFLKTLFSDALFRFSNISWLEVIDLLLVTAVFRLLLSLVRRGQISFLLRGVATSIFFLFVITVFLPLPTFDWLVWAALIVILVAVPVVFQPELRRFLERFGRSLGRPAFQQRAKETTLPTVVQVVKNLSANCTGMLLVLEGSKELSHIEETGVPIRGQLTSELLQTIFYEGTPLHDGAVIVRQDDVVAAGCVLPLSERQLYAGERRLGMRHRAALGLSEVTDAIAIIVSEETGEVSVARNSQLHQSLDNVSLREQLADFYKPVTPSPSGGLLPYFLKQTKAQLRSISSSSFTRQTLTNFNLWAVALLLALTMWAIVIQQTNPARQTQITNIPLRLENIPPNIVVLSELPETVSAVVKTTDDLLPSLTPNSFQAVVSLADEGTAVHRFDVTVRSSVSPVHIIRVEPALIDIELAEVVSQTMDVNVELLDEHLLSPAYQIQDNLVVTPAQVTVIGAAPTIERISSVQVEASVTDRGIIHQTVPVQAVTANGDELTGLTFRPAQVQIVVTVERRPNAREIGVEVMTVGELPFGYRIRRLTTTPAHLILLGEQEQLAAVENAVATVPIDISQLVGDLSLNAPLALPSSVEAVDSSGNTIVTVQVEIEVIAETGTLMVSRSIELPEHEDRNVLIEPAAIELLLSGPLPLLNQIEANSDLVRVLIESADLSGMTTAQSNSIIPHVVAPEGITVQLVPPNVQISIP